MSRPSLSARVVGSRLFRVGLNSVGDSPISDILLVSVFMPDLAIKASAFACRFSEWDRIEGKAARISRIPSPSSVALSTHCSQTSRCAHVAIDSTDYKRAGLTNSPGSFPFVRIASNTALDFRRTSNGRLFTVFPARCRINYTTSGGA